MLINFRILIAEAYTDDNHTMMYYGKKDYPIAHFPFNFGFVGLTIFPSPKEYDDLIKKWLDNMPAGGVANWVVSRETYFQVLHFQEIEFLKFFQAENHDNFRIGNRLNDEFIDLILITIMMLPGVACIYYGQEIGMVDNNVRPDQVRDHNDGGILLGRTRDGERLPMQWDSSMNAGIEVYSF